MAHVKTGPRVLAGLIVLAVGGYFTWTWLDKREPAQVQPQPVVEQVTPQATQPTVAPPAQAVAPAQAPAPEPAQQQPRTRQDAGLDALIKGGTK